MDEERIKSIVSVQMKDAISQSQTALLGNFETLLASKLNTFKSEIQSNQKEVADIQLSRLEQNIVSTDSYKFQKKGCEEQFKFNAKVCNKFRDVDILLDERPVTSETLSKSKEKIAEGISVISQRQKMLKLADSSELGWKVVNEYLTNPLADDSDDEKRIYKAEARAARKQEQDKMKRNRYRFNPYFSQHGQSSANQASSTVSTPNFQKAKFKPGLCYRCGKPGHWRAQCGTVEGDTQDKISIPLSLPGSLSHVEGVVQSPVSVCVDEDSLQVFCTTQMSGNISPAGRLKRVYELWKTAGANDYVSSIIEKGYRLPLKVTPNECDMSNNLSARQNTAFVAMEIQRLVQLNCVSKVEVKPHVVNPLTVAYSKKNKPRLVLDCREINPCLLQFKFKYEDYKIALEMFRQGDWAFTFDCKSAYHHIEIFPDHRKFLGFAWTDNDGVKSYYIFNVLPFGITTAGYIFSKVMRVPVAFWQSKGLRVIMFLDDGIAGESSAERAGKTSSFVQNSLTEFGFLVAEEKCVWDPKQTVTWLGLVWDFLHGTLHITDQRLRKLTVSLESFLLQVAGKKVPVLPVRFVASLIGQIISCQPVFGCRVRLLTRALYKCVLFRLSWAPQVVIADEAVKEILFWKDNCCALNGRGSNFAEQRKCDCLLFSDASGEGYGGYCSLVNEAVCKQQESPDEMDRCRTANGELDVDSDKDTASTTFTNVVSGIYTIYIDPLGKGRCVCRNAENECSTCALTMKYPVYLNDFTPDHTDTTQIPYTVTKVLPRQSPDNPPSDYMRNTIITVVVVVSSISTVALVVLFFSVLKEDSVCKKDFWNWCKTSRFLSSRRDTERYAVDSQVQIKKTPILRRKKVALIFADDHAYHNEIVRYLAEYLQVICYCDVLHPDWYPDENISHGPIKWTLDAIDKADFTFVINSEAAYKLFNAWQEDKIYTAPMRSPRGDTFTPAISKIFKEISQTPDYRKYVMISFDHTKEEHILSGEPAQGMKYQLMKHMKELLCHIHDLNCFQEDLSSVDLPLNKNNRSTIQDVRLVEAMDNARTFQFQNPFSFQNSFGNPVPKLHSGSSCSTHSEDIRSDVDDLASKRHAEPCYSTPNEELKYEYLEATNFLHHNRLTDSMKLDDSIDVRTIETTDSMSYSLHEMVGPKSSNYEEDSKSSVGYSFKPPSGSYEKYDTESKTLSEEIEFMNYKYSHRIE